MYTLMSPLRNMLAQAVKLLSFIRVVLVLASAGTQTLPPTDIHDFPQALELIAVVVFFFKLVTTVPLFLLSSIFVNRPIFLRCIA